MKKLGRKNWRARRGQAGVSAVEVMVGVLLFGTAVLAVLTTGTAARSSLGSANRETRYWGAVQAQTEQLMAAGYSNVKTGSGYMYGFPMTWTVSGSNPKQVVITARRPGLGAKRDTVLLFLTE
jgi:Tfp pilus assembly protein PilV